MPSADGRRIGLAHLSLLRLTPDELVDVAARAGFDFVGVRVRAVTDGEAQHDLHPGSALLDRVQARLGHCGVAVKDVEFLLADGTLERSAWLAAFETGQALGASTLTVAVADPDRSRVADTLALMAEDGAPYGITPAIEPITYQAVRSVPDAAALAAEAGADTLVDTLHVARFGGTAEELAAAAERVPLIQIADARAAAPRGRDALMHEARADRLPPGEGALDLAGVVAAVEHGLAGGPRAGIPVPVSVEVPAPGPLHGEDAFAWASRLHAAAVRALGDPTPYRPLTNPTPAQFEEIPA